MTGQGVPPHTPARWYDKPKLTSLQGSVECAKLVHEGNSSGSTLERQHSGAINREYSVSTAVPRDRTGATKLASVRAALRNIRSPENI